MNSGEVLLIRHAESEMNLRPHLIGGRSNWAPISALGEVQSKRLGLYLRENNLIPSKVISSPAVRTIQTAQKSLAAMSMDMEIETEDSVQELDQGDWEGLLRSDIYTPETMEYINEMNGSFRPPNGESPRDVARRMYAALDKHIDSVEQGDSLHIYTHGFAIRSLVGHLSGWTNKEVVQSLTDNTSITTLEHDGYWRVAEFAKMPE